MTGLIVFLAIALVTVFWAIGAYSRLTGLRTHFRHGFAQIDLQLKRRHDLIPHLVESIKGAMKHERDMLEAVIAARNQAVAANAHAARYPTDSAAMQQMAACEDMLTSTLGKMLTISTACPDLKTNKGVLQLNEDLSSTHNRIAFARQAYNDRVVQYNTATMQFPGSILATVFRFRRGEPLESTDTPLERRQARPGS